jgi:predicted signal transduction protein with EAL and GGDEF domain
MIGDALPIERFSSRIVALKTVGPMSASLAPAAIHGADILPAPSGLSIPASRKSFERSVAMAQLSRGAHVLAVLDVDHFRSFKNLHGIEVSNGLLRTISRRLECAAASAGGELIRLGADEFAVLIPERGSDSTMADWAKTLLAEACRPFQHRGSGFAFSATLGFAHLPASGNAASDTLRHARLAVTQGKQAGGGTASLCSSIEMEMARGRDELARDLSSAIARGEILPYYQPVIDLRSGMLVGMEVLARWIHPQLGLLSPSSFIPLVEEQGLCCALICSLLERVEGDALVWPQHWSFAFNTAPRELRDVLDYIDKARPSFSDILGAYKIDPSRIELEVTETSLMSNIGQTQDLIAAAGPFGARLVLDDFGTGYANFQQLRDIPFSKLKIDKSFVTHMLDDARAEGCVQAIINLAHHLGMKTTAEGVETPGVADRLAQMGCDFAQGYYYARPMPEAEVLWLQQQPQYAVRNMHDAA